MKESRNKQINIRVEPAEHDAAERFCEFRTSNPAKIAVNLFQLWVHACKTVNSYIEPIDIIKPTAPAKKIRYNRENHTLRCPTPNDPGYELDVELFAGDNVLNEILNLEEKGVPAEQILDIIGHAAAAVDLQTHYKTQNTLPRKTPHAKSA